MKVLISHPTGNSFFRAAAEGLAAADMLAGFGTTVATFPGNVFDRLSSIGPFAEFKRRQYNPVLQPYAQTWPMHEIGRMAASKAGLKSLIRHETGKFSVDGVYQNLDKHIARILKEKQKEGADAVYAYEDGALFSFREAKRIGMQCLYDLPIGYWRSARHLLQMELERWPDWASTLTNFKDSEAKLQNKDEEIRLADAIFVASSFTARTLKDYPGKTGPIEVIPYAFPPVTGSREYRQISGNGPLKLLFVGGLSQRKGIADLFAAVENIGSRVQLTVVGHKATNDCAALNEALKKHTWIPSLPHQEVLKLMREHDVLVFPSLFEGFGLVITEAMSQGTPVITTDRTAGPDLITDGDNGWLVEAGSTAALQNAIELLLQKPESIQKAGESAMETARLRTWEIYGREFAERCMKYHKQTIA
ncbi:glycosyl transferase family 1 [Mucilaginibacter sp. PPCGB 2223]|uniref:glycosyltransferase family 4 protein n=1 Tax=Mucilaginibacter sp. PPCGB 2223 TaxID=1886027 RepID=UPI0008249CB6|nr:glycosyltransferase family 4 protein [Mucilaginibacter sp. PPCGB 2223]OCX54546.1 glycosyl transferase family 1 [Mucilaginibacter sp. PPCGB 2223]